MAAGRIYYYVKILKRFPGIKVYETGLVKGGICLPGIGIFVNPGHFSSWFLPYVVQHEYGHYLDYKFSNDLQPFRYIQFYLRIGLPSIVNVLTGIGGPHRTFWTEVRANRCARSYFGERLEQDYERYFPMGED